jgi:hypothetical protein
VNILRSNLCIVLVNVSDTFVEMQISYKRTFRADRAVNIFRSKLRIGLVDVTMQAARYDMVAAIYLRI